MSNSMEKKIKEYFKNKYGWKITDREYTEVSDSLYHLGKAIHLYLSKKDILK